MRERPFGLYGAFGQAAAHKAVLCATDDAPFNARRHLAAHADAFALRPRFLRSVAWRFTLFGHAGAIHAYAYRTQKPGARLYHVPGLIATHRLLMAAHAIELLVREDSEPTDLFSRTHQNYVRVGSGTWLLVRWDQGRWVLDARSRGELDERIPLGSHIIVRN